MTEVLDARPTTDNLVLHHCAVADLHQHVAAESVDWIFTDPPYTKETMYTYSDLSAFAGHALKEGGSVLAMCGTWHLANAMQLLGEHSQVDYHWTFGYIMPGANAMIFSKSIFARWRPVLWFAKGKPDTEWMPDLIYAPVKSRQDTNHHHWGQNTGGFHELMRRFVKTGDVVCDPFLGGGTTALVALDLQCRFVGADIDADCLRVTRERLTERLF